MEPSLVRSPLASPASAGPQMAAAARSAGRAGAPAAFDDLSSAKQEFPAKGPRPSLCTLRALHRIVLVRLRYHQQTKDYVRRRTSEGKSKREIIRCLKRYVAREIYTALTQTGEQQLARAA